MGSKTTSTVTNTPPGQVLDNYANVYNAATNVANQGYQRYGGQLVAPLNQGQQTAIGQLQGAYGAAQPYINMGGGYLNKADWALQGVNSYQQAASRAGAQALGYGQSANSMYGQANNLANSHDLSGYMNPYTQNVVDTTSAQLRNQFAQQNAGLVGGAIGSGAYGGDRAGVAQAAQSGQQDLAYGSTIGGLYNQNYAQALAAKQANVGELQQSAAGVAGLGGLANQSGNLWSGLGQLQGQTAAQYGQLSGLAGYLGQTNQSSLVQGASAGLQGATLQQQTQQALDSARQQQFNQKIAYPFQSVGWLSNIAQGIGSQSGGTSSTQGNIGSQIAGLGVTGLGVLGATGAFGANGWGSGAGGLWGPPVPGHARGGRVEGYARGGLVASAPRVGGVVGLGGVSVMHPTMPHGLVPKVVKHLRPHFDQGGGLNPMAAAFDPTKGAPGLGGGAVALASPRGGNGVPGGGVIGIPRSPDSSQSSGLGVTSGDPSSGMSAPVTAGSGLGGGGGFTPNPDNKWLGLTAAGLGMMAGTSQSGLANIGAGGLEGLKMYTGLNSADRANALAQSDIAYKQGSLKIDQQKAEQAAQQIKDNLVSNRLDITNRANIAGVAPPEFGPDNRPIIGGTGTAPAAPATTAPAQAPATTPATAAPQGQGEAPASMPATAAPGQRIAPIAAGSPVAPQAQGAQPSGPQGIAAQNDPFWDTVAPFNNPYLMDQQRRMALYNKDDRAASSILSAQQGILDKGLVMGKDGNLVRIPGWQAAQNAAEFGKQNASEQAKNANDLIEIQPNPGGPTQYMRKADAINTLTNTGATPVGVGAGSPPDALIAKQPASFAQKQEIMAKGEAAMSDAFQNRQIARQRLGDLQNIMLDYQTGQLADAKANAVAFGKAIGIPVDGDVTSKPALFQQFTKDAIANVFSDVKSMGGRVLVSEIQGLAKATSNAEMQPGANASIVGQAKGILDYEDKHYADYSDWKGQKQNQYATDTAPFETQWARENPLSKFVDEARKGIAYQGQDIPADPSQRKVGQTYLSPTGKLGRWDGSAFLPVDRSQYGR